LVAYHRRCCCVPRATRTGADRGGRDDGARDVVGAHEHRLVGAGERVFPRQATGRGDDRGDEHVVVGMGLCAVARPFGWHHVLSSPSIRIRATPERFWQ